MSSSPTEHRARRGHDAPDGRLGRRGHDRRVEARRSATGSRPTSRSCEISTDKVDIEIPSPASGRVAEILVEPGQHGRRRDGARAHRAAGRRSRVARGAEAPPRPLPAATNGHSARNGSPPISPVVRRMADEHGIDLTQVSGSGPARARDEAGRARLPAQPGRGHRRGGARARERRSTSSRRTSRRQLPRPATRDLRPAQPLSLDAPPDRRAHGRARCRRPRTARRSSRPT